MASPDKLSHNADPEAHESSERQANGMPPPSVETREAGLMRHALKALASVPNSPETAEKIPSIAEQLQLICDVGKTLRGTAQSTIERIAYWEVYKKCINDFRDAYAKLPPVEKIGTVFKHRISDAMDRGDAKMLIKIFDEEKKEYAKPAWYKRVPGMNFLFGVGGGAAEMGGNLYELGKQGVKAATGDEQAREILKHVGKSFLELDKVLAAVIRKDEYVDSIKKGGEETGYVLGKSAFDVASALLTGGAAGATGKALAVGSHGIREAAHVAGHVAGHAAAEAVHVAGHATHMPEKLKKPI